MIIGRVTQDDKGMRRELTLHGKYEDLMLEMAVMVEAFIDKIMEHEGFDDNEESFGSLLTGLNTGIMMTHIKIRGEDPHAHTDQSADQPLN